MSQTIGTDLRELRVGRTVVRIRREFLYEFPKQGSLRLGERGRGDPGDLVQASLATGAGEHVAGDVVAEDRDCALAVVKGLQQSPTSLALVGQHTPTGVEPLHDLVWLRPEKQRSKGDPVAPRR